METLLLEIVERDFEVIVSSFCGLSEHDWECLLKLARKAKIFPQLYDSIREFIPGDMRTGYEENFQAMQASISKQKGIIHQISAACAQERMRVLVIKGLALSETIYGAPERRHCGDIDLLVDKHDLTRCDYVLRKLGFRQPDCSAGIGSIPRGVAQAFQALRGSNTPYPVRRKSHDTQLAPYYDSFGSVKLEVHDRLRYLSDGFVKKALWRAQSLNILGVRTLSAQDSFINLILTAYDNSETIYACQDGELNLRDYVDIRNFLLSEDRPIDWGEARRIFAEEKLSDHIAAVGYNYQSIYKNYPTQLKFLSEGDSRCVFTSIPFQSRLFDKSLRCELAKRSLKDTYANANSEIPRIPLSEKKHARKVFHTNEYGINATSSLYIDGNHLIVSWEIKGVSKEDLSLLAFQYALVPLFESDCLQYAVRLSFDKKIGAFATLCKANRLSQRLASASSGVDLDVSIEREGNSANASIRVPLSSVGISSLDRSFSLAVFPVIFTYANRTHMRSLNSNEEEFTKPQALYIWEPGTCIDAPRLEDSK